jgi:putative transposase
MARLARLAAAAEVHLLIQRGHNGQAVFVDPSDRETYLQLLREAAAMNQVAIHAYALTENEVMLLATPGDASGLSRMMQSLGRRYVAGFNRRQGRSGTLWDGRFRATVIEAEHYFAACLCYVELAPLRAGLGRDAQAYPWSSARHHLGMAADPLVSEHPLVWRMGNTPFEREAAHRQLLERALTPEQVQGITEATKKGWALGSDSFVAAIQERTGRRARPGRRGRPRKGVEPRAG